MSIRAPGVLLAIGVMPVFFVSESSGAQTAAGTSAVIEEIIVTSRYRAEKLSDVPDSITAFTVEDIERHRIERVNRVAALTPNLREVLEDRFGVPVELMDPLRRVRYKDSDFVKNALKRVR